MKAGYLLGRNGGIGVGPLDFHDLFGDVSPPGSSEK